MSIELLAPAGDMERLRMAVAYGADAVYLAGNDFGMRAFAGNFDQKGLEEAAALCRRHGVKVHVTCNTMPRWEEVERLPAWLEYLDALGVDAAIVADLGPFGWRSATPPTSSSTSPPRRGSPTTRRPGPGTSWGPAGSSWPGSSPWRRFGPSGPRRPRPWSWRHSSMGPCA